MKNQTKMGFFLSVAALILVISGNSLLLSVSATSFQSPHKQTNTNTVDPDLVAAVEEALDNAGRSWQPYDHQIDHVQYQDDGQLAIVWLAACDKNTGEPIGREPELALAEQTAGDQWQAHLQGEPAFSALFQSFQYADQNTLDNAMLAGDSAVVEDTVYGGYYLPWTATLEKRLTWSVSHTSCTPTYYCTHAFDFADGTMFPLMASKGGTVYHWKDDCANGDTSCTNSITLEDRSTTPWTYQIYIHLAYDSIPDALKTVGTPVLQGQHIGNVDDTGYSSGHHVHFMVVTADTKYMSGNGYVWGIAEDITFRDVAINWDEATQGGRPRLAYEAASYGGEGQTYYTSGNYPADPPTGGLTAPPDKQIITNPLLPVSGWGQDDEGVARMEILANYEGEWFAIDETQFDNPFTTTIDLCETNIPDGPFQIGLRVWDTEGNPSMPLNIRKLIKNTPCDNTEPTSCEPNAYQAALFAGPNFTGTCTTLGLGTYPDADPLAPLGSNQAASIKLGANVQINLFSDEDFTGRMETLTENDRHLMDNHIGAQTVSSVMIRSRSLLPQNPNLSTVLGPGGNPPTHLDSLILTWSGYGGTKFYAELYENQIGGPLVDTRYWDKGMSWSIGSLPSGTYAWRVRGRIAVPRDNTYDTYYSDWVSSSFTVSSASFPTSDMLPVPFYEVFDYGSGDWSGSGIWQLLSGGGSNLFWGYGSGTYQSSGSLTSPVIHPPENGYVTLRFDYLYNTESPQTFWDQRRLQISVENGRFMDLALLSSDLPDRELTSPYYDLSDYAGTDFRLRWFFDTVDNNHNTGAAWTIDNVRIDLSMPPSANDNDNSRDTATTLQPGNTLSGEITVPGDVDFFRFYAEADQLATLDCDAMSLNPASPLDTYLTLYPDMDDRPAILENDNQDGTTTDSALSYLIPETGWYLVQVRSADHPGAGSDHHDYRLTLTLSQIEDDTTDPTVTITHPSNGDQLNNGEWITAEAFDETQGSGIQVVEFWYHSSDWNTDTWQLLGQDYSGGDGWQIQVDTSTLSEGSDNAIAVVARDRAGNVGADGKWSIIIVTTPAGHTNYFLPVIVR